MISLSNRAYALCALSMASAPFWPGANAAAQDCTDDADCGGGFDCQRSTYWECSGGGVGGATDGGWASPAGAGASTCAGGAVAQDAGAATMAVDADGGVGYPDDYACHEVPSPDSYCALQDLPCTEDAECPEGLSCLNRYVWSCGGGGAAGSGDGSGGAMSADAGGGTATPPDATTDADGGVWGGPSCEVERLQRCMPREYEGSGSPTDGSPTSGGSSGSADGGVMPPAAGGAGGMASAGAGGGPSSPADDEESAGEDVDDDHGRGLFGWLKRGCSAGGPISSDPVGWIALGLTALVLRRRARRPA
jgi:uncharacterized protein (TIGR03382 family)